MASPLGSDQPTWPPHCSASIGEEHRRQDEVAWVDVIRCHQRGYMQDVAHHDRNQDAPHGTHFPQERRAREDQRDDNPRHAKQSSELRRSRPGRRARNARQKLHWCGHRRYAAIQRCQHLQRQENPQEASHGADTNQHRLSKPQRPTLQDTAKTTGRAASSTLIPGTHHTLLLPISHFAIFSVAVSVARSLCASASA